MTTPPPLNPPPTTAAQPDTRTRHLGRLRWAVRATLALGVAASIAANVLHARPNLISQLIAAWPPLALLLTVELISRIPTDRRWLATARLVAAAVIAGIAGWVSYWHMVGVAARYGETDAAASYLLPASVDGLVIVASISLVEIAGRLHAAGPLIATAPQRLPPSTDQQLAPEPDHRPATSPTAALVSGTGTPPAAPLLGGRSARVSGRTARTDRFPQSTMESHDDRGGVGHAEPPAGTAALVAYWYGRDPALHPAEIAEKIGRSERTVRRYWPPRPRSPRPSTASMS